MTIDSFIDILKNDPQSLIEQFNYYSQRRGKYNGFFAKHHPLEIIEVIRKASTGRPKSAEELAKLTAASRKNNGFRGEHHTVESIRKMNETKIRNGTSWSFCRKDTYVLTNC